MGHATTTIKTRNSVYELDEYEGLVRRVSGVNSPVGRFATVEDGEWLPVNDWSKNAAGGYFFIFPGGDWVATSSVVE